jgi:hypothetical protein
MHLEKDIEVDAEVLKEYTRCTLGGRLFKRTFSVLDNELQVTITAMPAELEVALERLPSAVTDQLQPLDVRLVLTLEEIKVFDAETSSMKVIYSKDVAARKELINDPAKAVSELAGSVDSIMLGVIRRMNATFVVLQNAIMEAIVDEDFYEGVGLI